MLSFLTNNLLWSQGRAIIVALSVLALLGYYWFAPLFFISIGFFVFSLYFFRSPERICPLARMDPSVIVCPADGTVVDVFTDTTPHKETADNVVLRHKISIFLSPLDVHVNWIPVEGKILKINYVPGSFIPAYLPKSSEQNEHTDTIILAANGRLVVVRQIAGIIARRICWWIKEGQIVQSGEKFGMIRFGSRVDLYLPAEVTILVEPGQKVLGGQTIIAQWQ